MNCRIWWEEMLGLRTEEGCFPETSVENLR